METFTVLANILDSAMSIWESKEKTKYIDSKIKLEKEFYEEYNKPIHKPGESGKGKRSDAKLDDYQLQLRILVNNAAAAIRASNSKT